MYSEPTECSPGTDENDPYSVLGVTRQSTTAEISAAFRALIKKHHPDVNEGRLSARAEQILAAYNFLLDPAARARLDMKADQAAMLRTGPRWSVPPRARHAEMRRNIRSDANRWQRGRGLIAASLVLAVIAFAFVTRPWQGVPHERAPAGERAGPKKHQAPTPAWLAGSWVIEGIPCEPEAITTFLPDGTWTAQGQGGRWRLRDNKLLLESEAASPSPSDSGLYPAAVERLAKVGPNEFRSFSGTDPEPRTFDRCTRTR